MGGGRALWLADPLSGAPGWARAESGGETRAVRAAGAMQGDRAQAPLACASDAAAGEAQQQPADQKERARQLLMRFSAEIALVVFEAKLGSAVLDSPRLTAEEFANVPVDVLPDEFVEAAGNPCSPDVALGHLSALRELEGTKIQQGKSNVEFKNAFSLTSVSRALQQKHNGYDDAQRVLLSELASRFCPLHLRAKSHFGLECRMIHPDAAATGAVFWMVILSPGDLHRSGRAHARQMYCSHDCLNTFT